MARARALVPQAEAVAACIDEAGRLAVRVTPGARTEALLIEDGRLVARVRARPEDGKANAAVTALVAAVLGVAPSRVAVLRGATSREKLLRVER